jgi:multiple sugar transport system ATP-binding protein
MARIELTGVSKRYGKSVELALDDLDLVIEDEEFFVLLGPSGCGKSTLLKLIAGLEEPTEGEIRLDGELMNYRAPGRRNIAMVFQNYALYPHMSVAENVEFPLKMAGMRRAARAEAARSVSAILGLDELLRRPVSELSGGQRQRVAVARALVREPRALLMDEPLSNLDALLRVETREELVRIHQATRRTILYVTHDQAEATTMADRIGVMRAGRLEQIGDPSDVYDRPRNRFIAGFIGSPPMNFLEGRVAFDAGRASFAAAGCQLVVDPPELGDGWVDGEHEMTLGLRPETLVLRPGGQGQLDGVVEIVENLGADRVVGVRAGETLVRVRTPRATAVREGDAVSLSWSSSDARWFGADGEGVSASPRARATA